MDREVLKAQRDDYIAFSLAAADLLVQVDPVGIIQNTYGAAKTLLKANPDELAGKDFISFFRGPERVFVEALLESARSVGRIDPTIVCLV